MPVITKDDQSLLFIHVPKCGGTSLAQFFVDNGYTVTYRDRRFAQRMPNWYRRCSPQHMHAEQLAQTFRLERFDAVFMIVREPFARFRSVYAARNAKEVFTDETSVESWADDAFTRYLADPYVYDNHLRPQWEFYLPGCHVYRIEDGLEAIAQDLDRRFDLGLTGDVPRIMDRKEASGTASSDVRLAPGLEWRLRHLYARDFTEFGY